MVKIRGFLFRKLKKKIKELRQVTQKEYSQPVESTEEYRKAVKEKTKKESGELMGEVDRLQKENKELKEAINQLQEAEDKELKELAEQQRKDLKEYKEKNRFFIPFDLDAVRDMYGKVPQVLSFKRHKTFQGNNGGEFKYWAGLELEDTKNGPLANMILSKDPKGRNLGMLNGISFNSFPAMFTEPDSIVHDLRAGRAILSVTPDGQFVPPNYMVQDDGMDEGEMEEELEKMKNIDLRSMAENADPETTRVIIDLYKELNRAKSEAKKAKIEEKKARMQAMDLKASFEVEQEGYDRATSFLSQALDKTDEAYDKLTQTKLEEMDARQQQALSEMLARKLWQAVDNSLDRVEGLGREKRQEVKEDVQKDMNQAASRIMESLGFTQQLGQGQGGEQPQ